MRGNIFVDFHISELSISIIINSFFMKPITISRQSVLDKLYARLSPINSKFSSMQIAYSIVYCMSIFFWPFLAYEAIHFFNTSAMSNPALILCTLLVCMIWAFPVYFIPLLAYSYRLSKENQCDWIFYLLPLSPHIALLLIILCCIMY